MLRLARVLLLATCVSATGATGYQVGGQTVRGGQLQTPLAGAQNVMAVAARPTTSARASAVAAGGRVRRVVPNMSAILRRRPSRSRPNLPKTARPWL